MQLIQRSAAAILFAVTMAATPGAARADGPGNGYQQGGSTLGVGAGVIVQPKYEGSEEYEAIGIPVIIPQFSGGSSDTFGDLGGRVAFRGLDDIRFRLLDAGPFEIGPIAGYRTGRDQDDSDHLLGLGDIDGGLVLGGYAGFRIANILFSASAGSQVTGDDSGVQVRFSAETQHQLTRSIRLTTQVGTTFADDEYMETFFGVTAAQARRSRAGLAQFDAESGLKDVHVDLGLSVDLTDRWVLKAGGRYARLIGDAADSPVIETEDQFSGMVGLAYRFDFN